MWFNFFPLASGSSLPCGSEVNLRFRFSKILSLSFWWGGCLLGMVLGSSGFTFWVKPEWIISPHGMNSLYYLSELIIPTEPPVYLLKLFILWDFPERIVPHQVMCLKQNYFFVSPKSGIYFLSHLKFYINFIAIPPLLNK